MVLSIFPTAQKVKLGKDLAGGATLLYSVTIKPGENASEFSPAEDHRGAQKPSGSDGPVGDCRGPRGAMDRDSTPLPGPEVKRLRRDFEAELAKLGKSALRESSIDDAMKLAASQRDAEILLVLSQGMPSGWLGSRRRRTSTTCAGGAVSTEAGAFGVGLRRP